MIAMRRQRRCSKRKQEEDKKKKENRANLPRQPADPQTELFAFFTSRYLQSFVTIVPTFKL